MAIERGDMSVTRSDLTGRKVWVMAKGYTPDEGGMQTYAAGVAEAYARLGAEVTVFTQTSAGPRREPCGRVDLIDIGAGGGIAVPARYLAAMRAELRRAGPPLFVHGTTWRTSLIPLVMGLPFLTTFHGREFMGGGALLKPVMRRVADRARCIVTVSHYTAAKLRGRLGGDIVPVVAHNGVSVPLADPVEREPGEVPLIFSLCRLESRKNIGACVRACARLRQEGLTFRYVIAGRGPELGAIRAMVEDLGLSQTVSVAGFVPEEEAVALHREAEIFVHPQIEIAEGRDFEGFGIVIADAMASNTAVIVGREGGAAELVEDGHSGLVVDGRSEDDLVAALASLLRDAKLRADMARAAKTHARTAFSWDRHVATILDAITEGRNIGDPRCLGAAALSSEG